MAGGEVRVVDHSRELLALRIGPDMDDPPDIRRGEGSVNGGVGECGAMYLRKNRVRSSRGVRTYVSICHNVWSRGAHPTQACRSRPVSMVNLGPETGLDMAVAEDIVEAIHQVFGQRRGPRGACEQATREMARQIRGTHEYRLRRLCSRDFGLRDKVPESSQRVAYICTSLHSADGLELQDPPLRAQVPSIHQLP